MKSLNKVMLIGNLGKDAETRFTPSGAAVTNFSIATSRRWKPKDSEEWKEETDWHNIVLWNAENVAQYLTKGKRVYVEGRLQTRSWEDKDGNKRYTTEVIADIGSLLLLDGGSSGKPAPRDEDNPGRRSAATGGSRTTKNQQPTEDDDIPF